MATSGGSRKLQPEDLHPLEQYARIRSDFRARVIAHKKNRQVAIGANVTVHFEDRLTMQYQVQEMLRIERIFEPEGIAEELGTYNALIPDGSNWKATFMIEYPDAEERRVALQRLKGVERHVWVRVSGFDRVYAIADEDIERENDEKTSSVHFLRFELTPEMIGRVKHGADVQIGIDHEAYDFTVAVPADVRASLADDLHIG
jgi:hypothetical protein